MSTVSSHLVSFRPYICDETHRFPPAASESTFAYIEAENFIESDFCNLTSKSGAITAAGIKSDKISLASVSGDIECSGLVQASPETTNCMYDLVAGTQFTSNYI